jgi:thiamine-monophosphate kinase
MDVRDLGEFGLIDRLRRALPPPADARLLVGIGDDAAVWRTGDRCTVATTDTLVASVHFLPGKAGWRDVGWKALAVNVSDIAAMGATPAFALVTLCLPPDTLVAAVDDLYAGLRECAGTYAVTIAGGDVVSSPVFTITVALAGEATLAADGQPQLLLRSRARAGDLVAVTGPLGGSAGGLRVLLEGAAADATSRALVERHMRPHPRVDAGRAAVAAGIACGIDVSDGLVQDLGHVCEASGLGAELWLPRVPIDAALAQRYPADAAVVAATGGEDYELLLVGDEPALERTHAATGLHLAVVGRMAEGPPRVAVLDEDMREVTLAATGWDHLKRRGG